MTTSINDMYNNYYTQNTASKNSAVALENKLNNTSLEDATDEELMDACKQFESYLVEQVMKQVEKSIMKSDEDKNEYIEMFGDMMTQEMASMVTDSGDLGIAQKLYEGMKNNMPTVKITPAETDNTEALAENTVTAKEQLERDTQVESEDQSQTVVPVSNIRL